MTADPRPEASPPQDPRRAMLELLDAYDRRHPGERAMTGRVRRLVERRDDFLLRSCPPGHITASAWIVSADHQRFLLTHHKKLDRWLQLGGHVDGEPRPHLAALREAQEESGMQRFAFVPGGDAGVAPPPIDVDVHRIPARRGEPEHEHHDVRYLLIAQPDQPLHVSDESHDLRWFPWADLERVAGDESVLRLARKARRALAGA